MIFALPAGIIGGKIGKKNTIRLGVGTATILMLLVYFINPELENSMLYTRIIFLVLGLAWASININSYPLIADMSPIGMLGTFTGAYYLFSSLANIVSPPLLGTLIDLVGYHIVFLYASLWFGLAFIFISLVKDPRKEREEA